MKQVSRRDFLKMSALGLASLGFRPWQYWGELLQDWPQDQLLGRNCSGGIINIRSRPLADAPIVESVYEDTVLPWLREVVGQDPGSTLQRRWVETPKGWVFSPVFQPVRYQPNKPVDTLPVQQDGTSGMWCEVSVPWVDIFLVQQKPAAPWLQEATRPRLYYSQIMWVDGITTNSSGQILYRVGEKYGSYGDMFWADAAAFRPLTSEEMAPINPHAQDKHIKVNLNNQTLSCFEGQQEVYFCQISSGGLYDKDGNPSDSWSTPVGPHPIWRKLVSVHMAGGGTGNGWDTPGIGWTSLFAGDGVAIHSTFWHNNYGVPRSHGCVNARPDDAKWIFRWTSPAVEYDPGDLTIQWPGGTIIDVVA